MRNRYLTASSQQVTPPERDPLRTNRICRSVQPDMTFGSIKKASDSETCNVSASSMNFIKKSNTNTGSSPLNFVLSNAFEPISFVYEVISFP